MIPKIITKENCKKQLLVEIITIFTEKGATRLYTDLEPDYENNGCTSSYSLNDIVDIAIKKGIYEKGYGTILVIAESYLGGKIYRYNNYSKEEWYEVGEMGGFA